MKKVALGTGLLICGTLGVIIMELAETIVMLTPDFLCWLHPPFQEYGFALFIIGIVLNVWGLIEKGRSAIKKTIFGTGLLICGTLGLMLLELLSAIHIASANDYIYLFHSPLLFEIPICACFIIGISLNVWGFIQRDKKRTSAEQTST